MTMRALAPLLFSFAFAAAPGFAAPPANDDFANAIGISALPFAATPVAIDEATAEANEPQHAFGSGGHSVWFRLRLAAPADIEVDTIGSGFDTVLAVYTGADLATVAEVAFADDGAGVESRLFLRAEANVDYFIVADGFQAADVGDIALNIRELTANDAFASARDLAIDDVTFQFRSFSTTTGYTREPLEPWHAGEPGGASAWFRWTAPSAGVVSVETAGSGFDTVLGVYTGSQLGQLRLVAANDQALGAPQSHVSFPAQSGATYLVAVDGVGGASGPLFVTLQTSADVLIVDDSGDGETAGFYDFVFPALGLTADIWDVGNGDPTASDLERFSTVVWVSGENGPGPSASAEAALTSFIGDGRLPSPPSTNLQGLNRCVVVSSQNYLDRGRTSFQGHLGVSRRTNTPPTSELLAQGPLRDILARVPGTPTRFPLILPYPNRSDPFLKTASTTSILTDAGNRLYGSFRLAGSAPVSLYSFPLRGLPPEILLGTLFGSTSGCGFNLLTPGGAGKLNGSRATFTWRTSDFLMSELGVTGFWLYLGSNPGARDLYDSGERGTGARQVTVSGLPTDGRSLHATLFLEVNGIWFRVASQFQAADPPEILEPIDAQLGSAQETFSWAGATQGDAWWLYLGSTPGGSDLFDSGDIGAQTHVQASGLPTDGREIYATLFHRAGGGWRRVERTFTAPDIPIVEPSASISLAGSQLDLDFDPGTRRVDEWWVYVGSSPGSANVFDSGNLGSSGQVSLDGLPTDGRTLYLTLFHRPRGGGWQRVSQSFVAEDIPVAAPTLQTLVSGASGTLSWDPNGTGATQWWVHVGDSPGGKQRLDSGNLGSAQQLQLLLPTDGRTLHVRLWYRARGPWEFVDATFVTDDIPTLEPELQVAVSGSSADFVFVPRTTPVAEWWLYIGNAPGQSNVYDSGNLGRRAGLRIGRLPVDGRTLHARLFHRASSSDSWTFVDQSFSAARIDPALLPAVIDVRTGAAGTRIVWDARGTPVTEWWLYIGSSLGAADILDSGGLGGRTDLTVDLGGTPPDFIRLYYRNGGRSPWRFIDSANPHAARCAVSTCYTVGFNRQTGAVVRSAPLPSSGPRRTIPTPLVPLGLDPRDR